MAQNEVKIILTGDGTQAIAVTKEVADAYKTLGASSVAEINKKKTEINSAYATISRSGVASTEEIKQAWAAKNKAIADLDKDLLSKQQGFFSMIKEHWLGISATIAVAMAAAYKAVEDIDIGAKAKQTESTFKSMADTMHFNAQQLIADMKELTHRTIDDSDLMQKALKGISQGLSPEDMKKIAEMSPTGAIKELTTVGEAYDRLTDSIANQMPKALRSMGFITKEQMGLVNRAISAGIEDVKLLDLAYANFRVQLASGVGAYDKTAEKMQQLSAIWKASKENIGVGIINLIEGIKTFGKVVGTYLIDKMALGVEIILKGFIAIEETINRAAPKLVSNERLAADMANLEKIKKLREDIYKPESESTNPKVGTLAEEKAKLKAIEDRLKAELAAKENAGKSLDAEKEAFRTRLEEQKKFADLAIEEERKYQSEREALIDSANKLGILSDEETYKQRLDYLEYGMAQEIAAIEKGRDKQIEVIKDWQSIVKALYGFVLSAAKPEERAGISLKETADLKQLEAMKKAIVIDSEKQINDARAKAAVKNVELYTQEQMRLRDLAVSNMELELDLAKKGSQAKLDENLEYIQREDAQNRWLYDHKYISEQEYYSKAKDLLQQETDMRVKFLDDEFAKFTDTKMKELETENMTVDQKKKIQDELLKAGEDYYNERQKIARQGVTKEIEINRELSKTFGSGIEEAINEYNKTLEWGFDRGKQITQDAMEGTQHIIENTLLGKFKLSWKSALDFVYGLFAKYLSQMITLALSNPINMVINAVGGMGSGTQAGMTGAASGGMGFLPALGAAGLQSLPVIGPIIGGSLIGGPAGMGTMVGGLAGGVLLTGMGTSGFGLIGAGLTSLLSGGGAGGIMSGALAASVVPVIGTIIGAVLGGLIGSLFGKGKPKIPEMGIGYSEAGNFPDLKYGGTYTMGNYGFITGGGVTGDTEAMKKSFLEGFKKIREETKKTFEQLGLDISGFSKDWSKTMKLEGKSQEEINAELKNMMGEYIGFAAQGQIKFEDFQKSGESLIDTVGRVLDALVSLPDVLKSFDTYISAINDNYDAIAQWTDQKSAADKNIKQLKKSLEEATDPSDAINYANQLKQAIYDRYQSEKQLIEGIVTTISQLDQTIRNLEMEGFSYILGLQQKIDQLRGTHNMISMLEGAMPVWMNRYQSATTPEMKMQYINYGIGMVDQWLSAKTSQIQAKYAAMQKAADAAAQRAYEAAKRQYELQIEGLQEQLKIIQGWKDLAGRIKETIRSLSTGAASPADIFERLGIAKSEIEKVRSLYTESKGEKRLEYANELFQLLQNYLSLGGEAYQRPSDEYKNLYMSVIKDMQGLQTEAEKYAALETDLLAQIKDLQDKSNALQVRSVDYTAQMNAEIDEANKVAANAYEWLQNEGIKAYAEEIAKAQAEKADWEAKLQSIIGDKTVGAYLEDLKAATITELQGVQSLLATLIHSIFPDISIPQYGEGGYVTKPTVALIGERGPEYIIPENKMGQSSVNISFSNQITINAGEVIDVQRTGGQINDAMIEQLTYAVNNIPKVRRALKVAVHG